MHKLAVVVASLALSGALLAAPSFEQLNRDAREAYEAKDFARAVTAIEAMAQLRPGHPRILTNLAGLYALSGRATESVQVLQQLARMQLAVDLSDTDFDPVRQRDDFKLVAAEFAKIRAMRAGNATVAFRIPQRGLITEGLAFDPVTGSFFVSSARLGKVVRIDRHAVAKDFAVPPSGRVHGLNGIGVDPRRRLLWACSSASPRVAAFRKGDANDASLVAFDLRSGAVVRQIRSTDDASYFDDLTVASDGTVYVSDSSGAVLRLAKGAEVLDTVVAKGRMRSPQGLTLSRDERVLYVSDYGGPIRAIDLRTGDVVAMTAPANVQLTGIDGLTRDRDSLIGVQNGVEPNRVTRFTLDASGLRIVKADVLAMNHPLMNEPTIGLVAKGDYYVVGTSEGNKFDKGEPDPATLSDGLVFVVRAQTD